MDTKLHVVALEYLIFCLTLLFCKVNERECENLLEVLNVYQKGSWTEVNYAKSAVTFSKGTSSNIHNKITHMTRNRKI